LSRLAADPRLQLTADDLAAVIADPLSFTGAATAQVHRFVDRIAEVAARYPGAANYVPEPIV
jgi:adenylosuccinate lyase